MQSQQSVIYLQTASELRRFWVPKFFSHLFKAYPDLTAMVPQASMAIMLWRGIIMVSYIHQIRSQKHHDMVFMEDSMIMP